MRLSPESRHEAYEPPAAADPSPAEAIAEIITPATAGRKPIQRETRGRKSLAPAEIQHAIEELPKDERKKSNAAEERARLENARSRFAVNVHARNTLKGYNFDWRAFCAWCSTMELASFPASDQTLSLHITDLLCRGLKVSSVKRRVAAVVYMHRSRNAPNPKTYEVGRLLLAAQRSRVEQTRKVLPLSIASLREISILLEADGTAIAIRNRAVLVVGFASALRSASIAALLVEDLEFVDKGVILRIRKEKQDQEGKGRLIGLPHGKHPETCPVRCLKAWLERRGSFAGPLFTRFDRAKGSIEDPLQPERLCLILQDCVKRIGLDPKSFGSHSMRAGFITAAGEAEIGEWLIASQSGHSDMAILRKYFRRHDVFKSNACSLLDL